jgi:hypothetical protein
LRFTDVPSVSSFNLFQILGDKARLPIFLNVPFISIKDHGAVTPAATLVSRVKLAASSPEKFASQDPLLADHPADHATDGREPTVDPRSPQAT